MSRKRVHKSKEAAAKAMAQSAKESANRAKAEREQAIANMPTVENADQATSFGLADAEARGRMPIPAANFANRGLYLYYLSGFHSQLSDRYKAKAIDWKPSAVLSFEERIAKAEEKLAELRAKAEAATS